MKFIKGSILQIKLKNIRRKTNNIINKFENPEKLFRRRLALSNDPSLMKDNHKEDEDKSYLKVNYKKENHYIQPKEIFEPIYSHLQDVDPPKFSKMPKTSTNWNNSKKLSKIIKKCSGILTSKASKVLTIQDILLIFN